MLCVILRRNDEESLYWQNEVEAKVEVEAEVESAPQMAQIYTDYFNNQFK
ncbi:hypothetical protein [Anaerophaga thermohalophila]|nr:hypothetical protein [Anaerophaga thermohalophila]